MKVCDRYKKGQFFKTTASLRANCTCVTIRISQPKLCHLILRYSCTDIKVQDKNCHVLLKYFQSRVTKWAKARDISGISCNLYRQNAEPYTIPFSVYSWMLNFITLMQHEAKALSR